MLRFASQVNESIVVSARASLAATAFQCYTNGAVSACWRCPVGRTRSKFKYNKRLQPSDYLSKFRCPSSNRLRGIARQRERTVTYIHTHIKTETLILITVPLFLSLDLTPRFSSKAARPLPGDLLGKLVKLALRTLQ